MVARLKPVKSLSKTLLYNEKKVTQLKAECIHTKNFLQDNDRLTYDEKLRRFQDLNDLNTRSRVKMLHVSLNFRPDEKLSNRHLAQIADRYMEGLQMQDQPYLVYRHRDANHPHLHIVTSLIRSDGTRVNTHRIANRLSTPARKNIEQEFGLRPSGHKHSPKTIPINDLQKITPNGNVPITQSMDQILNAVIRHYHFSDLNEYNAILRGYNITSETGSPGNKTRQHKGIYYIALDDQGNKISPPVMASQLSCQPTLSRLNGKLRQPAPAHIENLSSIRQRIDWTLDQRHKTLSGLVSGLQKDGIDIILPPRNGRKRHDHIFVDHLTRTAVTGDILGPSYSAKAFSLYISNHPHPSRRQLQPQQSAPGRSFNANVPQILSTLLHTHASPDADLTTLQQTQRPGYRHKY